MALRLLTLSKSAAQPAGSRLASQQGTNGSGLRSQVIELYKELIYLSREWPTDLRPQIKSAFLKNQHVQDAAEIEKLIARGKYVCREITATYHLRKYRAMKRRYYLDEADRNLEDVVKRLVEERKDTS